MSQLSLLENPHISIEDRLEIAKGAVEYFEQLSTCWKTAYDNSKQELEDYQTFVIGTLAQLGAVTKKADGSPRFHLDILMDPKGLLMVEPGEQLIAAKDVDESSNDE